MAADLVELRMNVAALKRVDPYIKDILGTATQVALYTFSAVKNEWEKTDVEGALYVCSRNGEPYNSILIMNRLKPNNLVEPIVKDLDWQMQAPFLLYRNARNCIYGIWFYNRDECVKITFLLEGIMEALNSSSKQDKSRAKSSSSAAAAAAAVSGTTGGGGGGGADIFSMLSRAQRDFNKTPGKPETGGGGALPPAASTPRAPDVTSQSVMEFFAKASTTKTAHSTPARRPTGDSEPLQPLLHRLMSNPAHSVEHIEKQQRAVTPQEQQQQQPQPPSQQPPPASMSVLRALKSAQPPKKTGEAQQHRNNAILKLHALSPAGAQEPPSTSTAAALDNNALNFMRIASPATAASPRAPYFLQQQQPQQQPPADEPDTRASPLATLLDTPPPKPALMPPIMFAASCSARDKPEAPEPAAQLDFSPVRPEPMTEKQIAQALQYLLKNDPEFLRKIHEAYVKSFTEIFSY